MGSSLRVIAELRNLDAIRHFVRDTATTLEVDADAIYDALLAVTEAATNIIVHGYRNKPGIIEIEMSREGDSLLVRLRDQADPFDPTSVPAPDLTLPLEKRPSGGMGIHVIRQVTDEMIYRAIPKGGNELTLVKKSPARSNPKEGTHEHHRRSGSG
jgi:anti-sigma regulatory factor (Ser/Thr protein kinase)